MTDNWQSRLKLKKGKEQEEILKELDSLVLSNKITDAGESSSYKSAKQGIKLPLIINIFAIVLIVSTFIISDIMFKGNKQKLNIQSKHYVSAEGKLLEELKRQTKEKIAQKEDEINKIKNQMNEINIESKKLKTTMDEQIAEKRTELTAQMQKKLDIEKKELIASGRSDEFIQQETQKIESDLKEKLETELDIFKEISSRTLAEKEAELEQARKLNEQMIAEIAAEKERIKEETKKRELELAKNTEQNSDAGSIQEEMNQLASDSKKEELLLDQINGSYKAIFMAINAQNYKKALLLIQSLENILNDPQFLKYKAIADRSNNDFNMLSVLKNIIYNQTNSGALTTLAGTLLSSRKAVKDGDVAYFSNNYETARKKYLQSIKNLPSIYGALQNLDSISKEENKNKINALLEDAEKYLRSGNITEAVNTYIEAASTVDGNTSDINKKAVEQLVRAINLDNKSKTDVSDYSNKQTGYSYIDGRNSAFSDIRSVVSVFDGEKITDERVKKDIERKSKESSIYADTIAEVLSISAKGKPKNIELMLNKPLLIGTVTYLSEEFIFIAPITDQKLYKGEKLVIKRKINEHKENYICSATITSATDSRVIVATSKDAQTVKATDLVYMNAE